MLAQHEIAAYLLQHELVSSASIVEGDLLIRDISRRNSNFIVSSQHGPCYLLKQGFDLERMVTIAREATVYQLLQSDTKGNPLNRYLPRCYRYDQNAHILVLEFVPNAQNLREYHVYQGRFSLILAQAMGKALGTLHRLTWIEGERAKHQVIPPGRLPWVLSIQCPEFNILQDFSSANFQLVKIIQHSHEFCVRLNELRQGWRNQALIHHDIKWDNWVVFPKTTAGRKTQLKLVDWELAGSGDPCWDIGSVFNDYLSFWLSSIPITGDTPPDHFIKLARYPLEVMQPAMRAYWQSYTRQMELDAATAEEWLVRAVQYGATRLVQTAVEQMQASVQLTGNIICLLQLSLNLLQRPQEAIVHLLGIPFEEGLAR